MPNLNLPGGIIVVGATDEMARVLKGRAAFVAQYCKEKGWDVDKLEMKQILEIRSQPGWKNPQ